MDLTFIILLILLEAIVTASEAVLWLAFRSKAVPISFPHETDASSLHFFTFTRLRLLALFHTIFLGLTIALLLFFLW